MRFKKLILKNFFRYYKEQTIDLDIKDDKNVISIIGENGRGKTTILSAFNFALYNILLDPLIVENMLNYKIAKEMKEGDIKEASVEIVLEENEIKYTLERFETFKKDQNGKIVRITQRNNGRVYRYESNGNRTVINLALFEEKFLIPKKLSGFFFFDGERINRLAKVDGKKEIKEAILNILGIAHLDSAEKDIGTIKRSLKNELKKYSNDSTYTQVLSDLDKVEYEKKLILEKIDKMEKKQIIADKEFEEITNKIKNSNIKELEIFEEQRVNLERWKVSSKKQIKEVEKTIKKHIGTNFKYYLAKDFTRNSELILEEKKKAGMLPSNVKETFIDDILKNKKCICGNCLNEGSEGYKNLMEMKSKAGSAKLDKAYYDLKNLIKKINIRSKEFYTKLDELIAKREELREKQFEIEEQLNNISNKLKNSDINIVKEMEFTRIEIKCEMNKLSKEIGTLSNKLEIIKDRENRLNKEIRGLKSNDKKIKEIQNKLAIVDKIDSLNIDFKKMFTEIVREDLDKKIKSVFSSISNKEYRIPVLTKDFELKITSKLSGDEIEESKKIDEVLSTGEGQITSLSFIGALVDYARENRADSIMSVLSGDEYPIVMDSPFGNLDQDHTKNVAKNIGKLAPQVIIVVSQKQWEGYVENNIKDQVNRKYRIKDGDVLESNAEWSYIEEEKI